MLWPLHRELGLRSIVMSTYQAASGAGKPAMEELQNATRARLNGDNFTPKEFAHNLAFNLIPHIDDFTSNGYTKEEMKVTKELQKIMNMDYLPIQCTAVRAPVDRCHSESIDVETRRPFVVKKVQELLRRAPGVEVVDDPAKKLYPMPSSAQCRDDVQVGRIRASLDPRRNG